MRYLEASYTSPAIATICRFLPRTAQGFQGFQDAGQAFLPCTTAFEMGFYLGYRHRAWLAGEYLCDGAYLVGQGAWPILGCGLPGIFFGRFLLNFKCHFGL